MRMSFFLMLGFFSASVLSAADPVAPANTDEAKVPSYTLPDPLRMQDGRTVDSAKQWNEQRRSEILKLFRENVYGKPVFDRIKMEYKRLDSSPVFDGKGIRHQYRLVFFTDEKPSEQSPGVDFLIYTPNPEKTQGKKVPAFLGLNFRGNHAIAADRGIRLAMVWDAKTRQASSAKEEDRSLQSRRWPLEMILDRGFAVGTAYYGDIEPDFNGGIYFGVRRLLYDKDGRPEADEANAIATWAWGLGRLLDVVVAEQESLHIDAKKVAVIGHSRLGKTSLWAGATDPRFALVVSNNSGCGGAALSRREFGETVHRINTTFPHWFCDNFKKYNKDVNALPVDQHELIALIAPRPVYIASASKDLWADPLGEFLSGLHADPVYRLLGTDGIGGVKEMPEVNTPVGGRIAYHCREGIHDIIEYDWTQYLNFAEKQLGLAEKP